MQSENRKREEHELIERILDGETDSYRVLVERYSSMVFHLVRRFCNDEDETRDLAQEIFVRGWEKLSSFDGRAAFSSWLYSLARNRCMDYAKDVRRGNVHLEDLEPEAGQQLLSDTVTPERELLEVERQQLLEQAVDQLPEEYAEPLLMKYRDGYSYEAISNRMGVSVSALKVRVHRARKEIKQWIESRKTEDR